MLVLLGACEKDSLQVEKSRVTFMALYPDDDMVFPLDSFHLTIQFIYDCSDNYECLSDYIFSGYVFNPYQIDLDPGRYIFTAKSNNLYDDTDLYFDGGNLNIKFLIY